MVADMLNMRDRRRMLLMLRGIAVSEFEVAVALEPLRDELGEVLA